MNTVTPDYEHLTTNDLQMIEGGRYTGYELAGSVVATCTLSVANCIPTAVFALGLYNGYQKAKRGG